MKSADIIRILIKDGWQAHSQKGSHLHVKHPEKPGRVTVPHPKKDLPKKTVNSILLQAGLKRGKH
jgi:predicted RNA binding protein YcfA (HicA-like mRNA interferase family)